MLKPHIVILGAGFGGVYVAKKLIPLVQQGKIDVTIVNRTNYFLFTPLLHEVATGGLSTSNVAEPLREIFAGTDVEICQGAIQSINISDKRVNVSGAIPATLHYDYLVIATGAETNYYNIPGAEKFTLPLKTLADAEAIRAAVIEAFEKAVYDIDPAMRLKQLSFAVVGGGATGVEVAAELSEFIDGILKRYYTRTNHCRPEEPSISLVHTGKELLMQFPPSLREISAKRLKDAGVIIHPDVTVTEVSALGLHLASNVTIPASTIIWAAGVKPSIPYFEEGTPPLVTGRLVVNEYFEVANCERVFAIGDVASYVDRVTNQGKSLPMLAQVAVGQADILASNIIASINEKRMKTFDYHSKGSMVSIGQWFAIGEIYSMKIAGRFTWWLWRTVYLFKFASWKKRVRIMIEWTLDVFYPRDITVK
jgi:NADH:ubiquinone reductase (H+-translocating)